LWKRALMLDNPEKTARLLAALKAAVPVADQAEQYPTARDFGERQST
jgi:hypothetical protein